MTPERQRTVTKAIYSIATDDKTFTILSNGKPLMTPRSNVLCVPTDKLADALLKEWQAQSDKINPSTLPLTQLVATTVDITARDRDAVLDRVVAYIPTELLCHRADEPAELCAEQQQIWQPFLDWVALRFDVRLHTGTGIMPVTQPEQIVETLRRAIGQYNNFALTGLQHMVETTGSFVLGLATTERQSTIDAILYAAELESLFQMKKWGEDAATLNRHANLKQELEVGANWFQLL